MKPLARTDGLSVVVIDNQAHLQGEGVDPVALHPVTAKVWELADGTLDVPAIAAIVATEVDANADQDTVFEALDALADAGLLKQRAAPPAGVSRRDLLRGLAGFSAFAAFGGVSLNSTAALAKVGDACNPEKALAKEAEQLHKANEKLHKWLKKSAEKGQKKGATKASAELSSKADDRAVKGLELQSEVSFTEGEIDSCNVDHINEYQLRRHEHKHKQHSEHQNKSYRHHEQKRKAHIKTVSAQEHEHKAAAKKHQEQSIKAQHAKDLKGAKEHSHKAQTQLKHSKERLAKRLHHKQLLAKKEVAQEEKQKQTATTYKKKVNKNLEEREKREHAWELRQKGGKAQEETHKQQLLVRKQIAREELAKQRFKERTALRHKHEKSRKQAFAAKEKTRKHK